MTLKCRAPNSGYREFSQGYIVNLPSFLKINSETAVAP
jgi:hypothetical protein